MSFNHITNQLKINKSIKQLKNKNYEQFSKSNSNTFNRISI
jgi:hypothetical protein